MTNATYVYAGAMTTKDGGIGGLYRRAATDPAWQRMTDGLPDTNVRAITVDPSNPATVLIGTDHGPFRSHDRGATWHRMGFPDDDRQIWSIAFDPHNPATVYAGACPVGVYRSEDHGDTWHRLPDPVLPARVKMPFACRVMRIAVNPAKSGDLYAALEVGGVIHSRDGGETWQDRTDDLVRLAELPHLKSRIVSDTDIEGMLDGHALCLTEADPGAVLLAVRMGIFRSTDEGTRWNDLNIGRFSPVTYARDIRVSPQDPATLYACLSVAAASQFGALYRSRDAGKHWVRVDGMVTARSTMMGVALHPTDTKQVYTVARRGQSFATRDGGVEWTETPLPPTAKDLYAIACG